MMRKFLLSGAAACVLAVAAAPAMAADLPVEPAPMEPAYIPEQVSSFTWTGFYVGANAGYAWGDFGFGDADDDDDIFDDSDNLFDVDGEGFIAGGQVGYNYQINQFVLGVEADIQYSDIDTDNDGILFDEDDADFFSNGGFNAEVDWFGTVRARAGFAMDRFMVYATGGLAYGQTSVGLGFDFDDPSVPGGVVSYESSEENMQIGYTVGAGVEGAITDNLTAKVEYLYVDLGDESYDYSFAGVGTSTTDVDFDAHVVRAGLNYKFSF